MKRLSSVIPAYNEARYIGDLLHAIAAVDTDATESIARSFDWVPNQGGDGRCSAEFANRLEIS